MLLRMALKTREKGSQSEHSTASNAQRDHVLFDSA